MERMCFGRQLQCWRPNIRPRPGPCLAEEPGTGRKLRPSGRHRKRRVRLRRDGCVPAALETERSGVVSCDWGSGRRVVPGPCEKPRPSRLRTARGREP
ncbi:hypothetical protein NDU88_006544 [Pleurodeles waltl]|uniref:Uncharacterized protein n=1 Tax=Pleurodeles waltl TaxID=8319 RepID=A0AAV7TY44_PLEWA|nr:hypothetical protein NDU88_006544 [Pleurodeles waltl]